MTSTTSSSSRPTCEQKIEKFNRTGYESWRYLVELALGRAKLKALLYETEDEKKYVSLSSEKRVIDMLEYDAKQDDGKLIICERLERKYVERVCHLLTVRQMMKQLDLEHRTSSRLGLIVAKEQYSSMRYNPNGDLEKYIIQHEAKAQTALDAGGSLSDLDRVDQLQASLPDCYDGVMEWFEDRNAARSRPTKNIENSC